MKINQARVLDKAEFLLKQMENKMEEQLNLPSAKHNVRLNPGNSEEKAFRLVVVLMVQQRLLLII